MEHTEVKKKKTVEINTILPGNHSIKTPERKNKKLPLSCQNKADFNIQKNNINSEYSNILQVD